MGWSMLDCCLKREPLEELGRPLDTPPPLGSVAREIRSSKLLETTSEPEALLSVT